MVIVNISTHFGRNNKLLLRCTSLPSCLIEGRTESLSRVECSEILKMKFNNDHKNDAHPQPQLRKCTMILFLLFR